MYFQLLFFLGHPTVHVKTNTINLPSGHRNGRNLAPSSRRTGQGDRKTDDKHHRRRERDLLPVPADVHSTAKGERGLISKHVHCRLVRCNRYNFSSLYV